MNTHPKYPTRVFDNEKEVPYYEDESVKKNENIWADPSNISEAELRKRKVWYNNRLISLDEANIVFCNNKPLTPIETGINGRGLLGKYGPNHAADPIVTRINQVTQNVEFIAAKRNDTNQYCIPGGMVDPGESVSDTLKREFKEEVASKCDPKIIDEVFKNGDLLYAGPTYNDPRTTNNAWIETYVMHYHISKELADRLKLTPQLSENSKVKWVSCNHPDLYGDHSIYVKKASNSVLTSAIAEYLLKILVFIMFLSAFTVFVIYKFDSNLFVKTL